MKKLLIGLAVASLFSGSAIVLACDLQDDASIDAASVAMSKGTPSVTAPVTASKTTKATPKATAKAPKTVKPDLIASKVDG